MIAWRKITRLCDMANNRQEGPGISNFKQLVQDEKLREVSVPSFLRADTYAVAEEILVNKYCTDN